MQASAPALDALRAMLAEKFPAQERKRAGVLRTGIAAFDENEGGLRRGAVTEVGGAVAGSSLLMHALLHALARERCFAALADAGSFFDPQPLPSALLARLLWVRCADATQAVKSADLLMRDGNLSLVVLDLLGCPAAQLRRIHAGVWHRLQRLAEGSSLALLVFTPQPMVESAQVRADLSARWRLDAQRCRRGELTAGLRARMFVRRTGLNPSLACA